MPRIAIHSALNYPAHYLTRDAGAGGEVNEDMCTVYRLYLESGKQINLHDWFHSFVVEAEQSDQDADEKTML